MEKIANYRGINRISNGVDVEDCFSLELINVYPQGNGLKITGGNIPSSAVLPFTRIILHRYTGTENYIGILEGETSTDVVMFNKDTAAVLQIIRSFPKGTRLEYATMKNFLAISDMDSVRRYVYAFDKGTYNLFYDGFEDISIEYSLFNSFKRLMKEDNADIVDVSEYRQMGKEGVFASYEAPVGTAKYFSDKYNKINKQELSTVLQSIENKLTEEMESVIRGHFLMCFNLTLFDGTETGMFGLRLVSQKDLTISQVMDVYEVSESRAREIIGTGYIWLKDISSSSNASDLIVFNLSKMNEFTLCTYEDKNNALRGKKDLIKKVNLYVSRPIKDYSFDKDKFTLKIQQGGWTWADYDVEFESIPLKTLDIPSNLMFKQKSWNIDEFLNGVEHKIKFKADQTTEDTMPVSASSVERAGKAVLFNNRLHYYASRARVTIGDKLELTTSVPGGSSITEDVFVYLQGTPEIILKYPSVTLETDGDGVPNMGLFAQFPDSRAYKIVIVKGYEGSVLKAWEYNLESSPAYNYACAVNPAPSVITFIRPEASSIYEEPYAVNVTENGNPIIFPVRNSYMMDSEVTSLCVSTDSLSEATIGQYPMNVYTTNGIYAMMQGTGTVLYSNMIKINEDVATSAPINTKFGQIYTANDAIFLLRGRTNKKLSLLLEGLPERELVRSKSLKKAVNNELVSKYSSMSMVDFRKFVRNATLAFSLNTAELLVSNADYGYTYVYSFIYDCWYKIARSFTGSTANLINQTITSTDSIMARIRWKKFKQGAHTEITTVINNMRFTCSITNEDETQALEAIADSMKKNLKLITKVVNGELIISTTSVTDDFFTPSCYVTSDNSLTVPEMTVSRTDKSVFPPKTILVNLDNSDVTYNDFLAISRPFKFSSPNVFKNIRRLSLNCKAALNGNDNISVYAFASNNLIDWDCVIQQQRKNADIAVIQSDRADRNYKFFSIVITGKALTDSEISFISFTINDDNTDKKPR